MAASRRQSFDARCEEFLSRQHQIAASLARDIAAVSASRPAALPALYRYYGDCYEREGVRLTLWQDGEELFSNQPRLAGRDDLSHEMRTPLTAIGGYAEYIQRASLTPDELLDATDTIRFESRRLLNLSNQLVRLSVLAHEPLELSPVDAAALASRAATAVRPKAAAQGVTVSIELAPLLPALAGDAELLESLLLNLLDNAVKASAPGGVVTLAADADVTGGCRFTVKDKGRGMTAQELRRTGQPFYRADKARSRAEGGAGLGVALCRSITAAHGASLDYESAPGKATTATLNFPLPGEFTASQQNGENPATPAR